MGRFEAQPPQFENGEQPIEGGETKRERWLRIMNERISEFQQIIRDKFYPPLIDRKGNYEYTEEDAQKIISLLRNEIEGLSPLIRYHQILCYVMPGLVPAMTTKY